jgi:hypothetical protein
VRKLGTMTSQLLGIPKRQDESYQEKSLPSGTGWIGHRFGRYLRHGQEAHRTAEADDVERLSLCE